MPERTRIQEDKQGRAEALPAMVVWHGRATFKVFICLLSATPSNPPPWTSRFVLLQRKSNTELAGQGPRPLPVLQLYFAEKPSLGVRWKPTSTIHTRRHRDTAFTLGLETLIDSSVR